MMRGRHLPWPAIAASLIMTLHLGACTPASLKKPDMTALSTRLHPLFEKTKTVCFGRLVMEAPATANVVFGAADVYQDIVRSPGDGHKLEELVAQREIELKKEEHWPENSGVPLYKETIDGVMPGQKIVVGWADYSSDKYKVQSFIRLGEDLYTQEDFVFPNHLNDSIAALNDVARRLRPRADDDIPHEPGLCIDGAFVAGPPDQVYGSVGIGIRLKEFPDVHFSVDTHEGGPSDETQASQTERLLKEAAQGAILTGHALWYARIKFFRRGERAVNGWQGYEVSTWKPSQKTGDPSHPFLHDNHEFLYFSQGEADDPSRPALEIQFNTGVDDNLVGAVAPSLSDEEAIAVWDKLLGGLHPRPAHGERKADAAPPRPPLGELAATGSACPQSGWWRCVEEARPVRGGRERFFEAGYVMPDVELLGERSVWQRLRGEHPSHRLATVWALTRYASSEDDAAPPDRS